MIDEIIAKLNFVELTYPFDDVTKVYKVGGKMFLLTDQENNYISVKNAPDKNDFLKSAFSEIEPGYHLNKQHWITVRSFATLPDGLIEELINDSYQLVFNKLTKKVKMQLQEGK